LGSGDRNEAKGHAMIGEALVFLKNQLNNYMKPIVDHDGTQPDPVAFIGGDNMEPLSFKSGAISVLLINLEEEHTLRAPDPYRRTAANGMQQSIQPDIRLNLLVVFVARYVQYEDSWHALSLIIRFFQKHRVFTHTDAPALSDNIERLTVELVTLPLAEQNEIWSALRIAYHPSVLYKVKMVVFQDEDGMTPPAISEKVIKVSQ
jgi:Pvc16 N-terminal domain